MYTGVPTGACRKTSRSGSLPRRTQPWLTGAPEQPLVERAVDHVAVAEVEGVLAERAVLEPVARVLRDRLALLDEGPVGLAPDGVLHLREHLEAAARRVEDPDAAARALLQHHPGARRARRFEDRVVAAHQAEAVVGLVDDDPRPARHLAAQGRGRGAPARRRGARPRARPASRAGTTLTSAPAAGTLRKSQPVPARARTDEQEERTGSANALARAGAQAVASAELAPTGRASMARRSRPSSQARCSWLSVPASRRRPARAGRRTPRRGRRRRRW